MTQTEEMVQARFHAFLKKRNTKTNAAMQEAQRLVNLYRILGSFGPDFLAQYNTMLLNASSEVQMALGALVSGHEVRQYLEFLRSELDKGTSEEQNDQAASKKGWLPSPADEAKKRTVVDSASPVWQDLMKAEEEKFQSMIDALRVEQEQALKKMFDQLSGSFQVKASKSGMAKTESSEYSEIIEEKNKEK